MAGSLRGINGRGTEFDADFAPLIGQAYSVAALSIRGTAMTSLDGFHDAYGATYGTRGERSVVEHYGRPARTHRAVRNGVGVYPRPADVVTVTGADRVEYVDNVLTVSVPSDAGAGCYGLLLSPNGRVRLDLYVYCLKDKLLLVLPPGEAEALVADWQEKVFIQDVAFETETTYEVVHVTGPQATEAMHTTLADDLPTDLYSFVETTIEGHSIFAAATEALAGEAGYDVLVDAESATPVVSAFTTGAIPAVPIGTQIWEQLTLEAGTPLLDPDFRDELPNNAGLRLALDFEKGCYVGQEVVSRIEHRGHPNARLVGLEFGSLPESGAELHHDGESIGHVTRAIESPIRKTSIGFGYLPFGFEREALDSPVGTARIVPLPFVEGSAASERLPDYPPVE